MMHHRTHRNSKEKNQRYHAKVRMLQHYGIQITNYDLERMAEIYRHDPDVTVLYRPSNRVVKAAVPYKGHLFPIVYDKHRHQIVTILKEEYLTPFQKEKFDKCKYRIHHREETVIGNTLPIPEEIVIDDDKEVEEIQIEDSPSEEDLKQQEDENQRLMREAFERLPNINKKK